MGKLTVVAVKVALKNPGTYQAGDGFVLKVGKAGAASWLLRVQTDETGHVRGGHHMAKRAPAFRDPAAQLAGLSWP